MSKNAFQNAKWIWISESPSINEYAEFCQRLDYHGGKVNVRFSVSGEYTLFVNGKYVTSVQYADFEHYKIYEDADITPYLTDGTNFVSFLCVYWGKSGMRYNTPTPGFIFEISVDGKTVSFSDENTPSRNSRAYVSGWSTVISSQLGYSFRYDASMEDDWLVGRGVGFGKSVVIEKNCDFYPRPIKPQRVADIKAGKRVDKNDGKKHYIFDLGEEYVGFCSFELFSNTEQNIEVYYGELLKDGGVKKHIGNRHFKFDYRTSLGTNIFTNYMLRLACRYIEVECEEDVDIRYIGILPHEYPCLPKSFDLGNELDNDIYRICLNTITVSMLEHYVDCPWREQCLYAFDSRNQMLVGYSAFEDMNAEYARANLLLMSKDERQDGIMSICFPSNEDLTIPSFCLYYVIAVDEYINHTGDLSLANEVYDKMTRVLGVFFANMKDGLICRFTSKSHWNFYDWSEYASGTLHESQESAPDCLINAIAVLSLKAYSDICHKMGKQNPYEGVAEEIKTRAGEKFFNKDKGVYFIMSADEEPTELVNSLCVLSGIADEEKAKSICEKLAAGTLTECSLSMKPFKYDALLSVDKAYKTAVLDEIRRLYKPMLDAGSTTVWETAKGESDFSTAASLCHGWSAVPIHYYNLFARG